MGRLLRFLNSLLARIRHNINKKICLCLPDLWAENRAFILQTIHYDTDVNLQNVIG